MSGWHEWFGPGGATPVRRRNRPADSTGEELDWPYPGLPANVVAEYAGHKVAGLQYLAPETIRHSRDYGFIAKPTAL
ncbi:hypothetical protein [Amycolatopsis sp. NPDC004079]|uniref:hypothetical protein n=1 Tax=Amycolatopsis sp. NPDC004079 TaxID=3154549 RepID=UPI0033B6CB85